MKDFFTLNTAKVVAELNSNISNGLSLGQIEKNREKYGPNRLTEGKQKGILLKIFEAICEPMILVLLGAAIITIGINISRLMTGQETDFIECIGIIVTIILSAAITILMEGHSEKAFQALQRIQSNTAIKVIRKGRTEIISQQDLVVGDIIQLEAGDKIPADCYIISAVQLTSDESSLTGESLPISKQGNIAIDDENTPLAERINMLF